MRFIVYVAAVLIAAGTVFILGKPQSGDVAQSSASIDTDSPAKASTVSVPNDGSVQKIALDVPGMHCQFGCFPSVKETLETLDGVQTVELAEQKSETELTDKTVFVTCTSGFDLDTAISKLKTAGFDATLIAK